jgi:hypothetical protein
MPGLYVPVGVTVAADVAGADGVCVAVALRTARRQGSATPPTASDAGTAVWPSELLPQHVKLPAADSAHVCSPPATTATWPIVATDAGTVCHDRCEDALRMQSMLRMRGMLRMQKG